MKHKLKEEMLKDLKRRMYREEKSEATIEKYMRDVKSFWNFVGKDREVDKDMVLSYKEYLKGRYAVSSVNSMLAALRYFFAGLDWYDCMVKMIKVQQNSFRSQDRELSKTEYLRLLQAAQCKGDERLYMLMQTIGATGIRVSELRFVTVESLKKGQVNAYSKGKMRTVLLPGTLCRKLKEYVRKTEIKKGSIFVTKSGRPMDRSNIFHAMKALAREAGVQEKKVFPHNLRHLFACTYYKIRKDIIHLADMLGHSNINTTRIYTLVSGKEQIRQIDGLGLVV